MGYPLWDASVLQLLDDDGGYTLFTPVFKAGADKINALFIYTYSPNGKVAYSLTSREVMESNAAYLKDPNFLIKINLFQHFDELLFNYGPPIYEDWKVLAGNQNFIDCYAELIFRSEIGGPLIGDGVISCSDGCYDDIEESQAFDTQEEMAWIYGNCQYAGQFNKFLTDNANINSTQLNDATQFFIDLGMANNIISFQVYKGLMNEITTFFADPNDENIADLVEYFNDNNLDPLAFSTFTLNLLDPNLSASVPRLFWNDMNSGDYWGKSAQRRSDMIHDYES